jgi:hypothetical protein
MAYQCSIVGEFQEGVRALLIDKDNQPKWKYSLASEVPSELINAHFERFRSVNVGAHVGNNSDSEKSINPLQSLAQEYGEHHA